MPLSQHYLHLHGQKVILAHFQFNILAIAIYFHRQLFDPPQSMQQTKVGQNPAAVKLSSSAFILANLTLVSTLLLWILIVGLTVGYAEDRTVCQAIIYEGDRGFSKYQNHQSCML